MSANLLDDILIEVTGVAHEAAGDVVGVLEAVEDVIDHRRLRALAELGLSDLGLLVKVLHPAVVLSSQVLGDVVLELDHVVVRDLLCVGGRDDGSSIVVDAVDKHGRRSRECCQRDASQGATHDGQCVKWLVRWGTNRCWVCDLDGCNEEDGAMRGGLIGKRGSRLESSSATDKTLEWPERGVTRLAKVPALLSCA